MSVVIKVENLSKYYRLGVIGGGTLREDFGRWWAMKRGRPDPLLKIGQENHGNREGGEIWALRDVNFEVREGEILGIIGQNGAGKSTLLKILSRITAPTAGRANIKGRVASLLEVGTGFHPQLTGRENIFLNGTILGMSRKEISSKLEEIVEFAEMSKFMDTPVKRYSSGMTVRLAFAVAAHLEPEILIVDEVLAVGDAQFQKKCLGKMSDVASEGRTIMFVSHNMTAIRSLCSRAILLKLGRIEQEGEPAEVIGKYLSEARIGPLSMSWPSADDAPGNEEIRLKEVRIVPSGSEEHIDVNTAIDVYFEIWNLRARKNLNFSLVLLTGENVPVFNTVSKRMSFGIKTITGVCHIPAGLLNDELYHVRLLLVDEGRILFDQTSIISFKVEESDRSGPWHGKWIGVVRPILEWDVK